MSITSRINEMSSHIEQAYDELQGLGADLTGIDKNIDNIASVLDDIYDDLPKVTGSGTSITLDDTRKGRLESTLSGNTSQYTTTGKNLFNIEGRYETGTGISYTKNSDGSYTLNGTANGNNFLRGLCYLNEQHTISYTSDTANSNVIIRTRTGTPSAQTGIQDQLAVSSTSGNLTSSKQFDFVEISIVSGTTLNNFKIYIQLEKGSSVTSFEPYTGGTASPNPDYPQEVHIVRGDNEINVEGKNFFDYRLLSNGTISGITLTNNNDGSITINGTATAATVFETRNFTIGENYKLSGCYGGSSTTYKLDFFNINNVVYPCFNGEEVSLPSNITGRVRIVIYSGTTVNNVKIYPMLSTIGGEFQPYQGNTYNIDLPVENLWGGFSNSFSRTDLGVQFTANQDGTITANGTATNTATSILLSEATSNGIYKTLQKGTYTVSGGGAKYNVEVYDKNNVVRLGGIAVNESKVSFTINEETQIVLRIQVASGVTINETIRLQLEKSSKANTYTPYGTTPIELCKIGNYQDYFYKDSDKWYLHKEIGKIDISNYNNTEPAGAWSGFEPNGNICMTYNDTGVKVTPIRNDVLSNKFTPQPDSMWNGMRIGIQTFANDSKLVIGVTIAEVEEYAGTTLNVNNYIENFKNYIVSLSPEIYIILATPTNTEITYQPLIDQLNELEKAMSKDGQTNISQVNNDLPFIISASALKEWQENTSLNSTLSMVNSLSLGNTLNTQENNTQPIEVDNIEPLEEEENEES